ncbi:MAG: FmdB family zinc ribbon protein [Burkholderiales bacterium]
MPLYEYQCDACSHRFERIQKFSDPPIETCPSCGGTVKKLLSSPAIQFKGSGWYITDYAKKGSTDGKGSSSTTGSSGDSASSATPATTDAAKTKTSGGSSDSKS